MKAYIYGLVDPRKPDEIKYVGMTKTPLVRHLQHCSEINASAKGQWVDSLRQSGLMPQMVMIEECSTETAKERELYWIACYGQLGEVTNCGSVFSKTLAEVTGDAEKEAINRVMTKHHGKIAPAAKELGISRPTLYDRLKQYGIAHKKGNGERPKPVKHLASVEDWLKTV